jgi:hypothetical protein
MTRSGDSNTASRLFLTTTFARRVSLHRGSLLRGELSARAGSSFHQGNSGLVHCISGSAPPVMRPWRFGCRSQIYRLFFAFLAAQYTFIRFDTSAF